MKIEEEIKQNNFKTEHQKATINLIYTGNWVYSLVNTILRPYNLSPEQFNVLRILRGLHPEPASVLLLNERMLDRMSNVSRIVEKLRQKGLLVRKECQTDRRQVDINVTQQGLDLLAQIEKETAMEEGIVKNISVSEAATLNQLLDKVRG